MIPLGLLLAVAMKILLSLLALQTSRAQVHSVKIGLLS